MQALIIGYGRAGKRHGKLLDKLGIEWLAVDPYSNDDDERLLRPYRLNDERELDNALAAYKPDFVVICTPPNLHLEQLAICLPTVPAILCEKPLCDSGQLDRAKEILEIYRGADSKVMVSYNYRYHPKLQAAKGRIPFYFTCLQDRDLPEWGLLLDHVSHDLDILRFLCGDIDVLEAKHIKPGWYSHDLKRETWFIKVAAGDEEIVIRESVGAYPDRRARLEYWEGDQVDIDPDPAMFATMYGTFLSGQYEPGLAEAIRTQELLEKCQQIVSKP